MLTLTTSVINIQFLYITKPLLLGKSSSNAIMIVLRLLLLSTLLFTSVNSDGNSGSYSFTFTSVGECPAELKDEELIQFNVRSKKLSRTKLMLNINASLHIPMDDHLDITVNLAKQTNQGWKDNFFILELKKACSALKFYLPSVEQDMSRQLNIKSCPIPVGNVSLEIGLNMNLESLKILIPVFPYGKYRSRVNLVRGRSRVLCVEAIVDVVPKKRG